MKKVGLIGVGAIGKGLLKNLLKNDCHVMAYDVAEKGKEHIRSLGGQLASHPKEIAEFADVIFLSLPNPSIIKELFIGSEGILELLAPHTTIFDLSTIDPATTKYLATVCSERNAYYLDCPVSGGPAGADEGKLTIMVGGNQEQYEKMKEYLLYVGENVSYIGESGLAQTLKLCHNMIVAANISALGETFTTGVKHGLHVEVMAEVIGKSMGNSRALEYFGPNIINNSYENVKFMLGHMHKDLSLYLTMAKQVNVPTFLGTNVFNLYQAAKSRGKAHLDHSAVSQVFEEISDAKIVNDTVVKAEDIKPKHLDDKLRTKKIGLMGVGAMGKGVLKNLRKHGFEVIAFDVSDKGREDIRNLGGIVAHHPKEVAIFADIIFLSLPNPKIIKEIFTGEEGILKELQEGTNIFDLSTIDPATTRELAGASAKKGAFYFDCPVSGGPAGADQGTMTIMVGGVAEQYREVGAFLELIGSNIKYIGESGLAQTLKLCHNMLGAANVVALGETYATGVKHGLKVEVMADIFGKSIGSSRTLHYFGPNIINNTYEDVKFMLNHMHKDLNLYVKMTEEIGVPSFVGGSTFNIYQTAKMKDFGHLDHTAVCKVIEELAGIKLVETVSI